MDELWKIAVGVAGIGAVTAFVVWSVYKQYLSLPIFQKMTKSQQFKLFVLVIVLTFGFGITGLVVYAVVEVSRHSAASKNTANDLPVHGHKTQMGNGDRTNGNDPPTSPHNYPSEKQVNHPPTQAQVDAPPQVPAAAVTFLYRNASGVDLRLALYDWYNHFHPLDLPLASADEPIIWDFPATNTFVPFSDFERSTGWFSFFVAEPDEKEWHELDTRNIFYSEWPTLTVEATGDEERPFKPAFGSKE